MLLALFPNDVANLSIPKVTEIPIDRDIFLFAFAITVLTAILFGIAPVLRAMRTEAVDAAREAVRGSTASKNSNRSRSVIVIAEIAMSLVVLTGAGLVVASFQQVVNAKLGFEPDRNPPSRSFSPPDRYIRARTPRSSESSLTKS